MSEFNIFAADTATVIGVVQSMHTPSTFILDRYFGDLITFPTDMIMFDEILDDEELMPIVAPTLPADPRALNEFRTHTARAPYMNEITPIPLTRGNKRVPGEIIQGEMSAAERISLLAIDELARKEARIRRRHEFMAASVLRTGGFAISAKGYDDGQVTMQFARPSNLQVQLASTARWGESGVSPYDDLDEWATEVEQESGIFPDDVIMGAEAWKLYYADPKTQAALDLRRAIGTDVLTGPQKPEEGTKGTYRGTVGSLNVFTYTQSYKDSQGARQRFIGDYDVILVSSGIEGARVAGAIMAFDGMDLDTASLEMRELEVFHRAFAQRNPDAYMANSQSGACPVPRRIKASGCWTVR